MKTGLPRHLIMTFLPSWILERSTSTLAIARTSADADILTRKSGLVVSFVRHLVTSPSPYALPCTVAFAPAAASRPIDPTIKYCTTRFETWEFFDLYAAKEGILLVSMLPLESLKGVSKLEVEAASTVDCCRDCEDALEAMREVEGVAERRDCFVAEGRLCRVQLRRAVLAVEVGGRMATVAGEGGYLVVPMGAWEGSQTIEEERWALAPRKVIGHNSEACDWLAFPLLPLLSCSSALHYAFHLIRW